MLMRRSPLKPGKGFQSRSGRAGAGLRDEQDEGHHCEPGQAESREQRLAERAARQIESALATASMVPGNVTMVPRGWHYWHSCAERARHRKRALPPPSGRAALLLVRHQRL